MANIQEFLKTISFKSERFLPVTNFEGRFWISDHGRLVSFNHKYKLLTCTIGQTGYVECTLRMKPVRHCTRIHVIVGEHFCIKVGNGNVRMTWNHIDGNKLNNHFTNLNYITAADNCAHAVANGLCDVKGEKHGQSKLTNSQVVEIYSLRNSGKSSTHIGNLFGIGRRQTSDILNGKAWQHITSRLS